VAALAPPAPLQPSSDRAGFTPSLNLGVPYNVLQVSSSSAGSLMATVQASTAFDAVLTLYSTSQPTRTQHSGRRR
jgi:hypothetical protein